MLVPSFFGTPCIMCRYVHIINQGQICSVFYTYAYVVRECNNLRKREFFIYKSPTLGNCVSSIRTTSFQSPEPCKLLHLLFGVLRIFGTLME